MTDRFWETKTLDEMSSDEWEKLCDGCGRCCMMKLEEQSGEVSYTSLVCDLLELETIKCTEYPKRHQLVADCVLLDSKGAQSLSWIAESCAYKRLAQGRGLAWWHPLISGSHETVLQAGISVKGRVLHASQVHPDEHESMVVTWVDF